MFVEPSLLEFLKKDHNGLLVATAVVSGAMLLWPLVRRTTGGPWVSVAQATQLINREDALVIDVRDSHAYASGHILGAKNVRLEGLGAAEIAKRREKPVIVYDDGGDTAAKAAAALRKEGFARVFNLSGGLGAWKQAGLPVEK
jgi:rhodanese-related sulfurtransferase